MALAAQAHAAAAPDARSFRDALARFATGVALTTRMQPEFGATGWVPARDVCG
jgi:hypothetical protein